MAFWNSTEAIDPKRQFKFRVTFSRLDAPGGGGQTSAFIAQSADRPQFTISDTTKIDYLDKAFHFPGKVTWNQVKIKFVDTVADGLNVSKKTYEYLRDAGFVSPDTIVPGSGAASNYLKTIGKNSAVNPLGGKLNVEINVLNSLGESVDKWALNNAWITTVALNNLDYASEGILTAEYTFRYDWATLT